MADQEYCYRYEDQRYAAPFNEYDEPQGVGRREVVLQCYNVLRRTPKGFWVDLGCGEKRIVNLEASKKFACLTKEDAMKSYIARKKRQVRLLSSQLRDAELFLKLALAGEKNDQTLQWIDGSPL